MTLDQLKAKLDRLSPAKVRFVANMVDSLSNPPQVNVHKKGTWITNSPDWTEYFALSLSVHHGITAEPLKLTAFETAFRNACKSVNWALDPLGSTTQRFVDLVVRAGNGPERRLSLKSTAQQKLSETRAHISKLTEAAWIQDERTARGRRSRILKLFHDYQQAVDAIIMLRVFRNEEGVPNRYQLLEIPTSLFDSVQQAQVQEFQSDAPIIACHIGDQTVARIAVDRSDAKITIRGILLSACVVHAEWIRA